MIALISLSRLDRFLYFEIRRVRKVRRPHLLRQGGAASNQFNSIQFDERGEEPLETENAEDVAHRDALRPSRDP